MESTGDPEPIFELAVECETLYATQISSLSDDVNQDAAKILSDIYQRFAAWAGFLGVFAESNACLDRRLRRHVELQDQVLWLLDIMHQNLASLFGESEPTEPGEIGSSKLPQQLEVSMQGLEAISGALDRLNQLGAAIRLSPMTAQISKAREFAQTRDLSSFEHVAYTSLKTLYPNASEGLAEQLTRSMRDTYALYLHRKSRKERLQIPRQRRQPGTTLHLILEEPTNDVMPDFLDAKIGIHDQGPNLSANIHLPVAQTTNVVPQSEPTSLDSEEVNARLQRLVSPSTRSKPVSVLVDQASYPRPARDSLICDWCFSPLAPDMIERSRWQHHINEDFKPYVCISEKCSELLPRFASSRQWLQHLITTHGDEWYREVHTPSSWICPLCIEAEVTFLGPVGLRDHIVGHHGGIFKEQQIKAIVRQSRHPCPRLRDTCPLCCYQVSDGHDSVACPNKRYIAKPGDQGPKRLKTNIAETPLSDTEDSGGMAALHTGSRVDVEVMARHVAAHLQSSMLLALRLISISGPRPRSDDTDSNSSDTDYHLSWHSSGPRDLDQDIAHIDGSFLPDQEADLDPDHKSYTSEPVPESEYVDWNDILDSGAELLDVISDSDDAESITQGALLPPQTEAAQARWTVIRGLVDSEFTFMMGMKVVTELYQRTAKSCRELSSEDIEVIFRNADHILQLSIDFQYRLIEATNGEYTVPGSHQWSSPPAANIELESASEQTASNSVGEDRSSPIGQVFNYYRTRMSAVYVEYLRKDDVADNRLVELEKVPAVALWLQGCQKKASEMKVELTDLHALLAEPSQRMWEYPRILVELLHFTSMDHPDHHRLIAALEGMNRTSALIYHSRKRMALRDKDHDEDRRESTRPIGLSVGPSLSRTLDDDPEMDALTTRFWHNVSLLTDIQTDLSTYLEEIRSSMECLRMIALQINPTTGVSPGRDRELQEKWRRFMTGVDDILKSSLPEHSNAVQKHAKEPFATLLHLYNESSLAIASRAENLFAYNQFMSMNKLGEAVGEFVIGRAEEFCDLDASLKLELPKLFSLTAKLVQICLGNFVRIQRNWLFKQQEALGISVQPFPGEIQKTIDDLSTRRELCDRKLQSLAICNGSLLYGEPHSSSGKSAMPSSLTTDLPSSESLFKLLWRGSPAPSGIPSFHLSIPSQVEDEKPATNT
ncbi:hypothetical protein BJX99DRAFT_259960 [Aspergillus californicus]